MSAGLKVVCWKWRPVADYRSMFTHEHVNTLRRMVERNYRKPHEFVCITDDWRNLDSGIRVIPLWKDLQDVQSLHGPYNPSCYRRLKAFSMEASEIIGERFVSMDLDVVITDDLSPLWDRTEDFVIWGDNSRTTPYNGSMWMLKAGSRTKVWTEFNPHKSPQLARSKGYHGSDQAWISYALPGEARWTEDDGVISYRVHIRREGGMLPKGTRIVFFNGHVDPWDPHARNTCPWIDMFYR